MGFYFVPLLEWVSWKCFGGSSSLKSSWMMTFYVFNPMLHYEELKVSGSVSKVEKSETKFQIWTQSIKFKHDTDNKQVNSVLIKFI